MISVISNTVSVAAGTIAVLGIILYAAVCILNNEGK